MVGVRSQRRTHTKHLFYAIAEHHRCTTHYIVIHAKRVEVRRQHSNSTYVLQMQEMAKKNTINLFDVHLAYVYLFVQFKWKAKNNEIFCSGYNACPNQMRNTTKERDTTRAAEEKMKMHCKYLENYMVISKFISQSPKHKYIIIWFETDPSWRHEYLYMQLLFLALLCEGAEGIWILYGLFWISFIFFFFIISSSFSAMITINFVILSVSHSSSLLFSLSVHMFATISLIK